MSNVVSITVGDSLLKKIAARYARENRRGQLGYRAFLFCWHVFPNLREYIDNQPEVKALYRVAERAHRQRSRGLSSLAELRRFAE